MVAVVSNKALRGLDLNSNPFIGTPGKDSGGTRNACIILDNCVLTRQRMVGNRSGFDYFTNPTSALIDSLFEYQANIIQHQTDNTLWHGDATSGTRTQYTGSYPAPSRFRNDYTIARGSLFFTSTSGVQKLDKLTNNPIRAGITKALDTRVSTTGSNGFMNGFSKAGYRVTWLRTDANNQAVRSDVSTRALITNNTRVTCTITSSAGTATVTTVSAHGFTTGDQILISGATQTQYNGTYVITSTGTTTFTYAVVGSPTSPATTTTTLTAERQMNAVISFTVPSDVLAGDSYEIWRTVTTSAQNTDPGDTCYLVAQVANTYAACATASYTDTTSDVILQTGAALYTNATQSGALSGNARPPMCSALCTYKDYGIYANTALDHQYNFNILGVAGLSVGTSTFVLTGSAGTKTYTASSSENVAARQFQVFSGGISNALNIQQTVQSLCHVINGDSTGSWFAEYTSGINDVPGLFRVWARTPLSGAFTATNESSTTGNLFSPIIPYPAGVVSSNDARPNRLFYSNFQAPDSVPILQNIDCGRLDEPILRVLAVRDACFIIKTDGVWYLSGLVAPFSLVELDSTCHCVAPASAVTLNNMIYMLSNQGVVKISISGVTVISFDIEPAIMQSALPLSNIYSVCFAIANESARQYILYIPTSSTDTYATQAYIFHTFIEEYVRSTKPAAAGVVLNSNYTLYISSGIENALLKARSAGDKTDYSDETQPVTITGQTGFVVTLTWASSVFTPTAGIVLVQLGAVSKVTAVSQVSSNSWKFTIDRSVSYNNGAASALLPIQSHIRISPDNLGESGALKLVYSVTFTLTNNTVSQASLEAATNEAPALSSFPVARSVSSGFGIGAWGNTGWGDSSSAVLAVPWQIDIPVPDCTGENITAGWIHSVAQEPYIVAQVSITYDTLSDYQVTQ